MFAIFGASPANAIPAVLVPALEKAHLLTFKSPVSVQDDPFHFSVLPVPGPEGKYPPHKTASVCNPNNPLLPLRLVFIPVTSVHDEPSHYSTLPSCGVFPPAAKAAV